MLILRRLLFVILSLAASFTFVTVARSVATPGSTFVARDSLVLPDSAYHRDSLRDTTIVRDSLRDIVPGHKVTPKRKPQRRPRRNG